MKFTHLHTHTHYSLLDGLSRIDELIAKAKEMNMEALAITDHGVMYGAIEFYKKAKKAGIKPIIGCEVYVSVNSMHDKRPNIDDKRYHLILLAKNSIGYKNLIKIVSAAHLEGFYYKPRVDKDLLRKHSEGLIALSACLGGELSRAIASNPPAGGFDKAKKIALEHEEIFGKGNYYIELQQHPHIEDQNLVTPRLIKLSRELKIPVVATQDSHYLHTDDAYAHDILLAVQTGNKLDDNDRLTMKDDDFSLLTGQEMYDKFASLGEDVLKEAFENTNKIAELCNVEIELGKTKLPPFPLPENYKNADEYLKKLVYDGLTVRYPVKPGDHGTSEKSRITKEKEVENRLEYELKIINQTGFASYFLIVQDFVNWAKQKGIIVGPGRGSAAGSLVSYLLNITNIDPLKYNLLFERFLNPERISMPDIDLDFDDARRDEVLKYVAEKYGHEHVAQVITFGTMAARGSIRDAGRALGYSYDFCDKVAKMVPLTPNQGKTGLLEAMDSVDELKQAYNTNPDIKKLIDSASRLEGVARHSSTHACAVVITPEPLTEYLPLQRGTNEKDIITQYEMHAIEDLGLLKMDFLGLANLTIIHNTINEIERNHRIKIDIDKIPLNDEKTFKLLQTAKSTGVFQFECLTGDTIVSNTTIDKLYRNKNKTNLRSVYLDTGKLRNNKIIDIVKSGRKEIFMVVTEDNRIIKASADHMFITKNGWKKLKDLNINKDQLLYKPNAKHVLINPCTSCKKEREILSENKNHNLCYRCSAKYFSNPSRPKSRRAISESGLKFYSSGGKPWNNGLTKKTNSILLENGKKISYKLSGVSLEMKYGKEKAEELKKIASKRFSGQGNPMFGKKSPHRKGGVREDLGHYVRSNWEADFARILNLHEVNYKYEYKTFTLSRENGNLLSYTPDFYTPHDNTFYEIKGWMHDLDAEKINLFKEQYPEYNFVLVNTTKFAELAMQYKKLVKWECPIVPNQLSFIKIKEIRRLGEEQTYDILMTPPGNNFIANSFVVHNSDGMKRYLKELKPTEIEDIIAMVSLYRPGPMDLIPRYIARKHHKEEIKYLHPSLEPIFKNTHGVMVYQEQLMAAVRTLAGFTLGEADIIRKAIGKKIKKLLDEQEDKFKLGAEKVGTPKTIADEFWRLVEPFSRYAFPRAHAACYAMIAYQTAYLKANYPTEFMAAFMNSETGDVERVAFLIEECKDMSIEVLPPSINESYEKFAVVNSSKELTTALSAVDRVPPKLSSAFVAETTSAKLATVAQGSHSPKPSIRFGLTAVKNVGDNVVATIIKERQNAGQFKTIEEFVSRIQSKDLNKKSLESLIKCGALDVFGERNTLLHNLEQLLNHARNKQKHSSTGQVSLFDGSTETELPPLRLATVEPTKSWEKLLWEKELLGLYVSDHPLNGCQPQLKLENVTPIKDISLNATGSIKIGGIITKIQKIVTKTGRPMIFSNVEDLTSKIELVVFPNVFEKNPEIWKENNIVVARGKINDRDGALKLLCDEVRSLAASI